MGIRGKAAALAVAGTFLLSGCAASDTPEPTPTTVAGSTVEVTGDLAYAVWSSAMSNFPDGITIGSPLYPVTGVEDAGRGTVRVFVQETLSDEQRDEVARQVFTLGALKNADLTMVVVRDASGRDSNHSRPAGM